MIHEDIVHKEEDKDNDYFTMMYRPEYIDREYYRMGKKIQVEISPRSGKSTGSIYRNGKLMETLNNRHRSSAVCRMKHNVVKVRYDSGHRGQYYFTRQKFTSGLPPVNVSNIITIKISILVKNNKVF